MGFTDITLTPRQDVLAKTAWSMVANNVKKSIKVGIESPYSGLLSMLSNSCINPA